MLEFSGDAEWVQLAFNLGYRDFAVRGWSLEFTEPTIDGRCVDYVTARLEQLNPHFLVFTEVKHKQWMKRPPIPWDALMCSLLVNEKPTFKESDLMFVLASRAVANRFDRRKTVGPRRD